MEPKRNKIFQKPVDGALFLHDLGLKLFPLVPNGKTPAFKGWQEWAIKASRQKIEDFGTANPLNNWGVSCEPSKLIVVDVDIKDGRNGLMALKQLALKNPFPKTIAVLTPSGGYHYYFKGQCKSGTDIIGRGIDIKSIGGYVVAPGSRIGGKAYELI